MKVFTLILCFFLSGELFAQNCEFETTTHGGIYNANSNKPKVISSDSCFYIINVGSATNYNEQHLRVTKYDKCNVLLKRNDYKIRKDLEGCDIIITKEPSNRWNICLMNRKSSNAVMMLEMDADCNVKEIFQTTNQSVSINHFIRSSANQYIFVGHKNSKATAFALDTLGNKTWQIVDITSLQSSFYNQIQKGNNNKIYLLGANNNKFTKSIIDMDGTITNTLYMETGITKAFDSLSYGLTFSQNGQNIYAFILNDDYQLLTKYDDLGREVKSNWFFLGKIKEIYNLKATSNGFAAFTNFENYLIDANLRPYFNKITSYGRYRVGNTSGGSCVGYHSDLLLENDSFIVSLNSWTGGHTLGPYKWSLLTFYKAKISSNLYKPRIVPVDLVIKSPLTIQIKDVSPVYVSWMVNSDSIGLMEYLVGMGIDMTYDTTKIYANFFPYSPNLNAEICARSYFKAQWSVDVCQLFTFYEYRTSITNTNAGESIKIYPNPTKEFIEVDCGHLNNVTFKLYNLFGQEMEWIEETALNNSRRRLRLSQIPKGIYILKINSNEGEFSQKILVEE